MFKVIILDPFYSGIEIKVFADGDEFKQSIKLRAIPNLIGKNI